MKPIAVTILTGFLGAGKTTLLRHILNAEHGYKIAVIENEFGEVPIDNALIGDRASRITTLSNGCICCSKSNELADALLDLLDGVDQGQLAFDRLIIECTGMADPGPITQTFFSHEILCDRILLTKTDVAPDCEALIQRLQQMNARAPVYKVTHGDIDLSVLFDIEGFVLNDKLTLTPPTPLFRRIPQAQNNIGSIVVYHDQPLELMQISEVMEGLLLEYADSLLRYKGILSIKDEPRRLLFQGVQRLYNADWDREWLPEEERRSTLVFIGVDLPEEEIRARFAELA